MNKENVFLSSRAIDISEHKTYIEFTQCLCYYDDENLNKMKLPYKGVEEKAKEIAQTLINMPVQAKYKVSKNGDGDFGSHEMKIDKNKNVTFGTESIGTHTDVWIENAEVTTVKGETKELPCLFAKCRLWKRYPKVCEVAKKLFESKNGLNSSWEIESSKYTYSDGVKTLDDYEFIANTLLGSRVTPAYKGTSKTVSFESEVQDMSNDFDNDSLMIAEALSYDIENINDQKEESELKGNTNQNETVDTSAHVGEGNTVETSAMTYRDVRYKLSKALDEKEKYACIEMLFPEDKFFLCKVYEYEEAGNQLDYIKYSYKFNEDETVELFDREEITLVVSPKDINKVVSGYEKEVSEKDDLIVKLGETITKFENQNKELSGYKAKFEESERLKAEKELSEKKENLIDLVLKSGQITKEEIETSEEIKGYIDALDKKSLMSIIGERLTSSIEKNNTETIVTSTANMVVEKSEKVHSNLNSLSDEYEDIKIDASSIMKKFLSK